MYELFNWLEPFLSISIQLILKMENNKLSEDTIRLSMRIAQEFNLLFQLVLIRPISP